MGSWKDDAMEAGEDKEETRLASILGISRNELDQLNYKRVENSGNDDMVYGYRIEFLDPSPKEILNKIERLENGYIVNLNLGELSDYEDDQIEEDI